MPKVHDGPQLDPVPAGTNVIEAFQPPFRWLSNFWILPTGTSIEHLYQAAKSTDAAEREAILAATSPGKAKKLGGEIQHLRPDWDQSKFALMAKLQAYKYSFPALRAQLLATGDCLIIEGTTWHDQTWGRCLCERCQGQGANALGAILMGLRASIRAEEERTPRLLRVLRRAPKQPQLW